MSAPREQPVPGVRLEMLSQPRFLSGAREMVSAIARRLGFSARESGQIALALDEALCNVIRHGYGQRTDGLIRVSLTPLEPASPTAQGDAGHGCGDTPRSAPGGGVQIVVEDEAQQVDPAQIRGRDLDDVRPGGLGVHIIREIMDEVVYEKRERAGMRLTMVKIAVDGADDAPGASDAPCCGG